MKGEENRSLFYQRKREAKRRGGQKKSARRTASNVRKTDEDKIEIQEILGDFNDIRVLSQQMHLVRSSQKRVIFLDFSNVQEITSLGMLWLYSEIYQKTRKGGTTVKCSYPTSRKCEKILQHIGFFDLIGKEARIPPVDITEPDISSWRQEEGVRHDGQRIAAFLDHFISAEKPANKEVYVTLGEIIANAVEHAYDPDSGYKTWVMFGRLSDNKDDLSICIGDLGKTIPNTMRRWLREGQKIPFSLAEWKRLHRLFKKDHHTIIDAVTHQMSGEFGMHRGNGLRDACRKIEQIGGKLSIYSRRGAYFSSDDAKQLNSGINGSIIALNIPLK